MTKERGIAVVGVVAVAAVISVALAGVALDLFRMLEAQRRLAGHVDAAATAAASALDEEAYRAHPELPLRLDELMATERACRVLLAAGAAAGCPGPAVVVGVDGDSVAVTLRSSVELLLVGRLSGAGEVIELEARAEARLLRGSG